MADEPEKPKPKDEAPPPEKPVEQTEAPQPKLDVNSAGIKPGKEGQTDQEAALAAHGEGAKNKKADEALKGTVSKIEGATDEDKGKKPLSEAQKAEAARKTLGLPVNATDEQLKEAQQKQKKELGLQETANEDEVKQAQDKRTKSNYGLPENASDEAVTKARSEARQNLKNLPEGTSDYDLDKAQGQKVRSDYGLSESAGTDEVNKARESMRAGLPADQQGKTGAELDKMQSQKVRSEYGLADDASSKDVNDAREALRKTLPADQQGKTGAELDKMQSQKVRSDYGLSENASADELNKAREEMRKTLPADQQEKATGADLDKMQSQKVRADYGLAEGASSKDVNDARDALRKTLPVDQQEKTGAELDKIQSQKVRTDYGLGENAGAKDVNDAREALRKTLPLDQQDKATAAQLDKMQSDKVRNDYGLSENASADELKAARKQSREDLKLPEKKEDGSPGVSDADLDKAQSKRVRDNYALPENASDKDLDTARKVTREKLNLKDAPDTDLDRTVEAMKKDFDKANEIKDSTEKTKVESDKTVGKFKDQAETNKINRDISERTAFIAQDNGDRAIKGKELTGQNITDATKAKSAADKRAIQDKQLAPWVRNFTGDAKKYMGQHCKEMTPEERALHDTKKREFGPTMDTTRAARGTERQAVLTDQISAISVKDAAAVEQEAKAFKDSIPQDPNAKLPDGMTKEEKDGVTTYKQKKDGKDYQLDLKKDGSSEFTVTDEWGPQTLKDVPGKSTTVTTWDGSTVTKDHKNNTTTVENRFFDDPQTSKSVFQTDKLEAAMKMPTDTEDARRARGKALAEASTETVNYDGSKVISDGDYKEVTNADGSYVATYGDPKKDGFQVVQNADKSWSYTDANESFYESAPDAKGNTIKKTIDKDGNLTESVGGATGDAVKELKLDKEGLRTITLANGVIIKENADQTRTVFDPSKNASATFDKEGNPVKVEGLNPEDGKKYAATFTPGCGLSIAHEGGNTTKLNEKNQVEKVEIAAQEEGKPPTIVNYTGEDGKPLEGEDGQPIASQVINSDKSVVDFDPQTGKATKVQNELGTADIDTTGRMTFTNTNGSVATFNQGGQLETVTNTADQGGGTATFKDNKVASVVNDNGSRADISGGRATTVYNSDAQGGAVGRYDQQGNLRNIASADGKESVSYNAAGDVTGVQNRDGSSITRNADGTTTVRNADGSSGTLDRSGNVTSVQSADGSVKAQVADGKVTEVTGKAGTANYDGAGNVTSANVKALTAADLKAASVDTAAKVVSGGDGKTVTDTAAGRTGETITGAGTRSVVATGEVVAGSGTRVSGDDVSPVVSTAGDTIKGSGSTERLAGGAGDDTLTGGTGDDIVPPVKVASAELKETKEGEGEETPITRAVVPAAPGEVVAGTATKVEGSGGEVVAAGVLPKPAVEASVGTVVKVEGGGEKPVVANVHTGTELNGGTAFTAALKPAIDLIASFGSDLKGNFLGDPSKLGDGLTLKSGDVGKITDGASTSSEQRNRDAAMAAASLVTTGVTTTGGKPVPVEALAMKTPMERSITKIEGVGKDENGRPIIGDGSSEKLVDAATAKRFLDPNQFGPYAAQAKSGNGSSEGTIMASAFAMNKPGAKNNQMARSSANANPSDNENVTCVIRSVDGQNQYVPITEASNLTPGEMSFTGEFATSFDKDGKSVATPSGMLRMKPLTQEEIDAAAQKASGSSVQQGDGLFIGKDLEPQSYAAALESGEKTEAKPPVVGAPVVQSGGSLDKGSSGVRSLSVTADGGEGEGDGVKVSSEPVVKASADGDATVVTGAGGKDSPKLESGSVKEDGKEVPVTEEAIIDAPPENEAPKVARKEVSYGDDGVTRAHEISYDANDKPLSETYYGADGVTPVSTTTYKDGVPFRETDFKADGVTPDAITEYRKDEIVASLTTFDESGKSVTEFAGDGVTPTKVSNYNADGSLKEETTFKNGEISSTTSYDGKNHVTKHYENKELRSKESYEDGVLKSRTSFGDDGSETITDYRPDQTRERSATLDKDNNLTETSYDENDVPIESLKYDANDNLVESVKFDETGDVTSITKYKDEVRTEESSFAKDGSTTITDFGPDGQTPVQSSTLYKDESLSITDYENGQKKSTTLYDKDNNVISNTGYSYGADQKLSGSETYDAQGNLISQSSYDKGELKETTSFNQEDGSVTKTSYGENSQPLQSKTVFKDSDNVSITDYKDGVKSETNLYDSNNKVLERTSYDAQGNPSKSFQFDKDGKINGMTSYENGVATDNIQINDDGTETLTKYGPDGKTTLETATRNPADDSLTVTKYENGKPVDTSVFDKDNNLKSVTEYKDGVASQKFEYDVDGQKTDVVTVYGPDGKTPSSVSTFKANGDKDYVEYEGDGVTKKTESHFNSEGSSLTNYKDGKAVESATFDKSGKVKSMTNYKDGVRTDTVSFNGDGSRTTTNYDASGEKAVDSATVNADGKLISKTTYKDGVAQVRSDFDGKGNETQTTFEADGKTPKKEVTYNDKGEVSSVANYAGGKITDRNTYGVDVNGNQTQTREEYKDGKLFEKQEETVDGKTLTVYDENEKPSSVAKLDANGEVTSIDNYTGGVLTDSTVYGADGTDTLTRYDGDTKTVTVTGKEGGSTTVYNKNQIVSSTTYDADKKITSETTYKDGNRETEVAYGNDGQVTTTKFGSDGESVLSRSVMNKDGSGTKTEFHPGTDKVKSEEIRNADGTRSKTEYDIDHNKTSESTFGKDGFSGTKIDYDPKTGKKTQISEFAEDMSMKVTKLGPDEKPISSREDRFNEDGSFTSTELDEKGNVKSSLTTYLNDDNSSTSYKRDADGNLTKITNTDADGYTTYEANYDPKDSRPEAERTPTSETFYDLDQTETVYYNKDGKMTDSYKEYFDGSGEYTTYNENSIEKISWNSDYSYTETKVYAKDSNGNAVEPGQLTNVTDGNTSTNYKDGVITDRTTWNDNGKVVESFDNSNPPQKTLETSYGKDGKIGSISEFKDGNLQTTTEYADGKVKSITNYDANKKPESQYIANPDGTSTWSNYKDGVITDTTTMAGDGTVSSVVTYKDGVKDTETSYDGNGSRVSKYKDGQIDNSSSFDKSGNLTEHVTYENGVVNSRTSYTDGQLNTVTYNPDGSPKGSESPSETITSQIGSNTAQLGTSSQLGSATSRFSSVSVKNGEETHAKRLNPPPVPEDKRPSESKGGGGKGSGRPVDENINGNTDAIKDGKQRIEEKTEFEKEKETYKKDLERVQNPSPDYSEDVTHINNGEERVETGAKTNTGQLDGEKRSNTGGATDKGEIQRIETKVGSSDPAKIPPPPKEPTAPKAPPPVDKGAVEAKRGEVKAEAGNVRTISNETPPAKGRHSSSEISGARGLKDSQGSDGLKTGGGGKGSGTGAPPKQAGDPASARNRINKTDGERSSHHRDAHRPGDRGGDRGQGQDRGGDRGGERGGNRGQDRGHGGERGRGERGDHGRGERGSMRDRLENARGERAGDRGGHGHGRDGGRDGNGRDGGRDGHGRDVRGRDGHGRDGHGRDGHVRDGHGRDGHGRDGHGRDGHGRDAHGRDGHALRDEGGHRVRGLSEFGHSRSGGLLHGGTPKLSADLGHVNRRLGAETHLRASVSASELHGGFKYLKPATGSEGQRKDAIALNKNENLDKRFNSQIHHQAYAASFKPEMKVSLPANHQCRFESGALKLSRSSSESLHSHHGKTDVKDTAGPRSYSEGRSNFWQHQHQHLLHSHKQAHTSNQHALEKNTLFVRENQFRLDNAAHRHNWQGAAENAAQRPNRVVETARGNQVASPVRVLPVIEQQSKTSSTGDKPAPQTLPGRAVLPSEKGSVEKIKVDQLEETDDKSKKTTTAGGTKSGGGGGGKKSSGQNNEPSQVSNDPASAADAPQMQSASQTGASSGKDLSKLSNDPSAATQALSLNDPSSDPDQNQQTSQSGSTASKSDGADAVLAQGTQAEAQSASLEAGKSEASAINSDQASIDQAVAKLEQGPIEDISIKTESAVDSSLQVQTGEQSLPGQATVSSETTAEPAESQQQAEPAESANQSQPVQNSKSDETETEPEPVPAPVSSGSETGKETAESEPVPGSGQEPADAPGRVSASIDEDSIDFSATDGNVSVDISIGFGGSSDSGQQYNNSGSTGYDSSSSYGTGSGSYNDVSNTDVLIGGSGSDTIYSAPGSPPAPGAPPPAAQQAPNNQGTEETFDSATYSQAADGTHQVTVSQTDYVDPANSRGVDAANYITQQNQTMRESSVGSDSMQQINDRRNAYQSSDPNAWSSAPSTEISPYSSYDNTDAPTQGSRPTGGWEATSSSTDSGTTPYYSGSYTPSYSNLDNTGTGQVVTYGQDGAVDNVTYYENGKATQTDHYAGASDIPYASTTYDGDGKFASYQTYNNGEISNVTNSGPSGDLGSGPISTSPPAGGAFNPTPGGNAAEAAAAALQHDINNGFVTTLPDGSIANLPPTPVGPTPPVDPGIGPVGPIDPGIGPVGPVGPGGGGPGGTGESGPGTGITDRGGTDPGDRAEPTTPGGDRGGDHTGGTDRGGVDDRRGNEDTGSGEGSNKDGSTIDGRGNEGIDRSGDKSTDGSDTGKGSDGTSFNPTGNPLTPAEQLAVNLAILEAIQNAMNTGSEKKPEQEKKEGERKDVIEKKEEVPGQNLAEANKLQELIDPLAHELKALLVGTEDGTSPLSEAELMNKVTKHVEAHFTAPNGEEFELITIRDAFGNIISQHYVNGAGQIVSESLVDQMLNFIKTFQTDNNSFNWGESIANALTSPEISTSFVDGQFDLMSLIQKIESDRANNDPFSNQNDPNNDPNQQTVSFIDNLLAHGPDGANLFDEIFHVQEASGLEADIASSINPLEHTWFDPVIDSSALVAEDARQDRLDWLKSQKDKELDEDRRRDEEEKERARRKAEQDAREYAAALMAAAKEAARRKELADRKAMQEQLMQQQMRRKYVVLPGDTLESIAQKMFYNRGLAPLIYEINRSVIPLVIKDGKRRLNLKPRTVIYLPTPNEIKRYNSRLFGKKNHQGFEYEGHNGNSGSGNGNADNSESGSEDRSRSNLLNSVLNFGSRKSGLAKSGENKVVDLTERRRSNIQKVLGKLEENVQVDEHIDDRIIYSCRLGDSLRSIALRHPSLKDVGLWVLLAELNNLSTETDDEGYPLIALKRNTKLRLPLPHEIEEFRDRSRKKKPRRVTREQEILEQVSGMDQKPAGSQDLNSAVPASEASAPASSALASNQKGSEGEELAVALPDEDYDPEVDSLLRSMRVDINEEMLKDITHLAEGCRLSRTGQARGSSVPYTLSLEIKKNNNWIAIITYEVTIEQSWRFESTPAGSRKGKQINLPVRLAKQMAENDISKNWRKYVEAYNIQAS